MPSIRINVFGRAVLIHGGQLTADAWKKFMAACGKFDLKPEVAFFTPGFLAEAGLCNANGKPVATWKEMVDTEKYYGYFPEHRSTIEIKEDGKRKSRFAASTIIPEGMLFPVFETEFSSVAIASPLILRESLTGLTGVYRFRPAAFDPGLLKFHIHDLSFGEMTLQLITGISYQGQLLEKSADDAVVTGWEMTMMES